MPLPDLLPIQPFARPVRGGVVIPGSKSLTNRALLLTALCDRPVTLRGALFSEDTELMAEALRKLGLAIVSDGSTCTIRVEGQRNAFTTEAVVSLFVGLAGTAARFLTALCAAAPRGVYRLDGVPQMRKRPMRGLIDALRSLGADIRCLDEEGCFPIEIHAAGLRGGPVSIDARESSQMLSALLMVAPLAHEPVRITILGDVRWPFVRMTTRLMEHFGQPPLAPASDGTLCVPGKAYAYPDADYTVEPDATAASYFLALPLVTGGEIRLPGLFGPGEGLQGDTAFMDILAAAGASIASQNQCTTSTFRRGGLRKGVTADFSEFSDTFLTLAAIAPLLDGPTRISGIAHTRKQETDRVAGMARELTKLGQHVVETENALEIHPRPLRSGVEIETYGDHRFAMSFGILGCHDLAGTDRPWLSIKNPACCAKTFPNFFELLEDARQRSVMS